MNANLCQWREKKHITRAGIDWALLDATLLLWIELHCLHPMLSAAALTLPSKLLTH